MLSYIFQNSLILSHWTYLVPFILLLISAKRILFSRTEVVVSPAKKKLSEEEYIGEFVPDEDDDTKSALEDKPHIPFNGATVTLSASPLESARKFYDIMNNRRSVRMFSDRHVNYDVIEKCIHAAATGPSGAHTEPWTFCVISDPAMKAQIREIVEAEEYQNYLQRMSRKWVTDLRPLQTHYVKEYLTVAPYLVLVFKQTYGVMPNGGKKQHYYNEISTSIATGILLCAFQCAGLSSLVTTPLNCGPALSRLLGRPKNEKLLVLLPTGYPAEDCTIPDLERKSVDEVLVKY